MDYKLTPHKGKLTKKANGLPYQASRERHTFQPGPVACSAVVMKAPAGGAQYAYRLCKIDGVVGHWYIRASAIELEGGNNGNS